MIVNKTTNIEGSDTAEALRRYPRGENGGVVVSSETAVDVETDQCRGEAVIGAGHREAAIDQIEIEPFSLCRPARRDENLSTLALVVEPKLACSSSSKARQVFMAQITVGQAGGAVDKDVVEGDPGAAAPRCRTRDWKIAEGATVAFGAAVAGTRLRRRRRTVPAVNCSRPRCRL